MRGDDLAFLFSLACLALIAWFVWLNARRRRDWGQAQADLQHRLLEKFNSPQEVGDFLQTEGGRRFLAGLSIDRRHAGRRILLALQIGTVVSSLGLATVALGFAYPTTHRSDQPNPGIVMGALALALGAGFLISAGISYRLSKTWGLLAEPNGKPDQS